jgi:hypothetical protein
MLRSEFNSYPRHTVTYLGVPYADARFINGVWYFRAIDRRIAMFWFQRQVSIWEPLPQPANARQQSA